MTQMQWNNCKKKVFFSINYLLIVFLVYNSSHNWKALSLQNVMDLICRVCVFVFLLDAPVSSHHPKTCEWGEFKDTKKWLQRCLTLNMYFLIMSFQTWHESVVNGTKACNKHIIIKCIMLMHNNTNLICWLFMQENMLKR